MKKITFTLILSLLLSTPAFATNECSTLESVSNIDLDNLLKEVDISLKTIVMEVDKNSTPIDQELLKLAKSFDGIYKFMKQNKDLTKNKSQILQRKEAAAQQNIALLSNLETVDGLFDNTKSELDLAYCSISGLHNYFISKLQQTSDKETIKFLSRSKTELDSKVKKLNKIMSEFNAFFDELKRYKNSITASSDALVEFANSVITFENNSCPKKKMAGEICQLPASDVEALLSKQRFLIKANKTFAGAKEKLFKQSINWGFDYMDK